MRSQKQNKVWCLVAKTAMCERAQMTVIISLVYRASLPEAVDSGLIPSRVKPMTLK